jgi:hypothetical protein
MAVLEARVPGEGPDLLSFATGTHYIHTSATGS